MTQVGAALTARGLKHSFGGRSVLSDIELQVPAGSFVSLIGQSGVGKSTLLRILAGLILPDEGEVLVAGQPLAALPRPVGIVFQQDNLMPWRTAYDNVRLPLELAGLDRPSSDGRVRAALALVGLAGHEKSYPAQLSGGMAQRVSLARALVHEPDVLLLDEPFGALDALTRELMAGELLRIWRDRPVTVFMITHSIHEAILLSDEVLVLAGQPGRISTRLPVPLPRPRELSSDEDPQFTELVRQLRAALKPK